MLFRSWPYPSPLVRFSVERAQLILSVSRYTRAKLLDWCAIAPERVVVIPDTVEPHFNPGLPSFAASDGDGCREGEKSNSIEGELRRRWNLGNRLVLLTVARMEKDQAYKGHDRVMEAIPGLVAAGHDIVYLIVGEGGDRPRLEECARALGVSDRTVFAGALPAALLPSVYRLADVFVMPSLREGFGIVFLQAMACGTPAVGMREAGSIDALADGELGVLSEGHSVRDAIAAALARGKTGGIELSNRAHTRFGSESFAERLALVSARGEAAVPGAGI